MTIQDKELLLIELPEDATEVDLMPHLFLDFELCYKLNNELCFLHHLPAGNLELIGVYPEMTEEQAEKVVEVFEGKAGLYLDYENPIEYGAELGKVFDNALSSFTTRLHSLGVTKGKWAVLKIKEGGVK